ncbi:hypothetical protein EVA_18987 [gut metagenome]|uniref:Uncharacterized protein n=1 Tax=gut metagenome TaxID=749906 RepID=J9FDB5_9ZZZZ
MWMKPIPVSQTASVMRLHRMLPCLCDISSRTTRSFRLK